MEDPVAPSTVLGERYDQSGDARPFLLRGQPSCAYDAVEQDGLREIRLDVLKDTAGPLETLLMLDENESGLCAQRRAALWLEFGPQGVVERHLQWEWIVTDRKHAQGRRERLWALPSRPTCRWAGRDSHRVPGSCWPDGGTCESPRT